MANPDEALPQAPQDDDEALRKKLLARVGIAGAVVVALVGMLTLFDGSLLKEGKPPARVAAVKPIAPPAALPAQAPEAQSGEQKAAEEKADQGQAGGTQASEGKPAEEKPGEPKVIVERPEPPVVAAEPERTEAPRMRAERPMTVPATPRQATMRPSEPAVARKPELAKEGAKEVARVMPPLRLKEQPAPASRPIARAVESARQFLVQVGVFSNLANAEELRAKLENAGVPAHIEARVQVGPFANREEAEQAREKMMAIGVEPGIIVTRR